VKLADLKRIPVGTRLRVVRSLMGPCDKLRVVHAVKSNAIQFTGDGIKPGEVSWLYFPKASEFRDDGDGFTVLEGETVCAQYKFEITERSVTTVDEWGQTRVVGGHVTVKVPS
jgi:hypothetical protein